MRNLIMAGLIATSLLPAAAQAQYRDWGIDRSEARELRNDRREVYEERRDLDRAYRYGDRRDIRDARDEYRDARRDWGGGWYAPRSAYHSRHHMNDWHRYGYARPSYNQRWVRNGRDALLIDTRNGYVIRVIRRHYW